MINRSFQLTVITPETKINGGYRVVLSKFCLSFYIITFSSFSASIALKWSLGNWYGYAMLMMLMYVWLYGSMLYTLRDPRIGLLGLESVAISAVYLRVYLNWTQYLFRRIYSFLFPIFAGLNMLVL